MPCTIVVPEGWRREQIAAAIDSVPVAFSGQAFLNATGPGAMTPYDYINGRPPGTSLEGYLFPGTYAVQNETTAEDFRDMLLAAFDAAVPAGMRADAAAQGISFHEALTMASIIQRESRAPETQARRQPVLQPPAGRQPAGLDAGRSTRWGGPATGGRASPAAT